MGGFGRVELVSPQPEVIKTFLAILCHKILFHHGLSTYHTTLQVSARNDKTKSFALKCLKKRHIVDTKQQDHIVSEKNLLIECKSIFVTRYL